MAINAAIEYVKKKEGIELEGKDRLRYQSIIINDEEFHVFAFFKYGLLIDYDNNTHYKNMTKDMNNFCTIQGRPCKKCDRDSHGNSVLFPTTNRGQFGPNPHRIPGLFHVISPGFICFPLEKHDMDFGQVQFMEFLRHLLRK